MYKPAHKWISEKISKVMPGTKPGDRRLNVSKAQFGGIIARNFADGFFTPQEISKLVQDSIQNNLSLEDIACRPDVRAKTDKAHREAIFPDDPQTQSPVPEAVSHHKYLSALLVPKGKIDFLQAINEAVLDNQMNQHAAALDALRTLSKRRGDHCYDWVIQGKLSKVLNKLEAGKLPGYKPDWLRSIVLTQARCSAWITACERVSMLRRLSTKAYDKLVDSLIAWPTVSHICIALLAGPANLMSDMITKSQSPKAQKEIEDNPEEWLHRHKYLPRNRNSKLLISHAKNKRDKLIGQHGFDAAQKLVKKNTKRHLEELNELIQAKTGHFRALGWTKMTYPEYRLGVTASEGTAFVAEQLRNALQRINELMNLSRCARLDAQYRLYHLSTLLRGTIEPDKNSAQVGQSRDGSDPDIRNPNPNSNAGAQPFKNLHEKLKDDSTLLPKLKKVLGFSGDECFNCKHDRTAF